LVLVKAGSLEYGQIKGVFYFGGLAGGMVCLVRLPNPQLFFLYPDFLDGLFMVKYLP
jgi:hypothetical protein